MQLIERFQYEIEEMDPTLRADLIHNIELLNTALREEGDMHGICSKSFENFICFLQHAKNIKFPMLSLTPDNMLYVKWNRGHRSWVAGFFSGFSGKVFFSSASFSETMRSIRVTHECTPEQLAAAVRANLDEEV